MGVTEDLASINGSTTVIDNTVARSIESNDTSILQPVFKETENIRAKTKDIKRKVEKVLVAKHKAEKELEESKRFIWIEFIYQIAPVVFGALALLLGRLTNDPADTKFGIACFIVGAVLSALYATVGYWGIISIGIIGVLYFIYAHEKKDIAKKQKATNMNQPNIN